MDRFSYLSRAIHPDCNDGDIKSLQSRENILLKNCSLWQEGEAGIVQRSLLHCYSPAAATWYRCARRFQWSELLCVLLTPQRQMGSSNHWIPSPPAGASGETRSACVRLYKKRTSGQLSVMGGGVVLLFTDALRIRAYAHFNTWECDAWLKKHTYSFLHIPVFSVNFTSISSYHFHYIFILT